MHMLKSEKVYQENIKKDTIIMRRAIEDDIDTLVKISRISFPDQLIWCSRKQAAKAWKKFINSKYQEVWVCQFNNEVVSVIRFEKNSSRCYKENMELKPGLVTVFGYLIVRPRLLFEKIIGRIINKSSTVKYYAKDINILVKNCMWCHTNAVLPKMRKKGLGSKMMSICERRGVELGYDSLIGFIKPGNKASMRCHEKLGFKRVGKIKGEYLYIKMLSANNVINEKVT